SVAFAAHHQRDRAAAVGVPAPGEDPGRAARRNRGAAAAVRAAGQRSDPSAEDQRLSGDQRETRSGGLNKRFHDFSEKMRYLLFNRIRDTAHATTHNRFAYATDVAADTKHAMKRYRDFKSIFWDKADLVGRSHYPCQEEYIFAHCCPN